MASKEFNHWQQIADAVPKACAAAVKKTAVDGQANVQAKIRSNGQIDTGFLVNSVYFVTSDQSTYQGGADALPEISRPSSPTEAYVAVAARYGIYQNNGTRYQPARPFFEPGMQQTQASFEQALSLIEQKLAEAAK
jgi:HK97 gp10 family phage protein